MFYQPGHDCVLDMHPVLGLVKDNRVIGFHYGVGYLTPPLCGQANCRFERVAFYNVTLTDTVISHGEFEDVLFQSSSLERGRLERRLDLLRFEPVAQVGVAQYRFPGPSQDLVGQVVYLLSEFRCFFGPCLEC